jgi:hypothetical protein
MMPLMFPDCINPFCINPFWAQFRICGVWHSGKPGEETAGNEMTVAEKGIVGRRLAIGAVLAAATAAFALVPTERLDGTASKPTYFYLVPIIRSIVRSLCRQPTPRYHFFTWTCGASDRK